MNAWFCLIGLLAQSERTARAFGRSPQWAAEHIDFVLRAHRDDPATSVYFGGSSAEDDG